MGNKLGDYKNKPVGDWKKEDYEAADAQHWADVEYIIKSKPNYEEGVEAYEEWRESDFPDTGAKVEERHLDVAKGKKNLKDLGIL